EGPQAWVFGKLFESGLKQLQGLRGFVSTKGGEDRGSGIGWSLCPGSRDDDGQEHEHEVERQNLGPQRAVKFRGGSRRSRGVLRRRHRVRIQSRHLRYASRGCGRSRFAGSQRLRARRARTLRQAQGRPVVAPPTMLTCVSENTYQDLPEILSVGLALEGL